MLPILLCAALCAVPSMSFAQQGDEGVSDDKLFAIVDEATRKFQGEEYEEALVLFERAYELRADSNILFNIGLCHDRMDDPGPAITAFRQFIAAPDASPQALDFARGRLEALLVKADLDASRRGEARAAERTERTRALGDAVAKSLESPEQVEAPPNYARIALIGVGAAVVVTGGLIGGRGILNARNIDQGTTVAERTAAAEQARRQAVTGDLVAGAGAALLVGGVLWALLDSGDAEEKSGTRATLAPSIGPRGARVTFSWHF